MQLYGPRAELRRTDKRKGQPAAAAAVQGGVGGDDGMMESEVSQSRRDLLLVESSKLLH